MMAESAPPKDTQPQAHRDVVVQPAPDIANGIVSTSVEDFMVKKAFSHNLFGELKLGLTSRILSMKPTKQMSESER